MKFNFHFMWGILIGLCAVILGAFCCWIFVNALLYFNASSNDLVNFKTFIENVIRGGGGNHRLFFVTIAIAFSALPFFYCMRKGFYNTAKGILFMAILGVISSLFLF
ncbi:MAG: hypothetical protein AAF487_11000 [Bacteroidota bacterium]